MAAAILNHDSHQEDRCRFWDHSLAGLAYHWWNWRPNLDDYAEPEAVEALELTLDGVPFPIRSIEIMCMS